jgi:thioesterase III
MMSVTEKTIRAYHTDCFGHVYHGRYVELLEDGRWSYLEDNSRLKKILHEKKILHAVVHMDIAFRKAARLGERLRIETGVENATENSVTMGQNIFSSRTGEAILSAKVTQIYYMKSPENFLPVSDKVFSAWTDLQKIIN